MPSQRSGSLWQRRGHQVCLVHCQQHLLFGIWKVRAKHDSGPLHMLSSLIVGWMWLAYVAILTGGAFPTV